MASSAPQEAVRFKSELGKDFKLVTPGIRPAGSDVGDQRRIMTPEQALAAGVDYMVIGRPVTQSANPAETLKAINASLKKGRNDRFQQPSGLLNRERAYRRAESESGTSEGDGIVRIQRQTSGRKGKGFALSPELTWMMLN
jgi:orotidine-5'-phosphate decarboxylase